MLDAKCQGVRKLMVLLLEHSIILNSFHKTVTEVMNPWNFRKTKIMYTKQKVDKFITGRNPSLGTKRDLEN